VDVLSHGRAVLSLDADCGDGADAKRLSEALTVIRSVLEDEVPTFAGRIYSVDGAVNRPAPVQPGGVPIVVFLHGDGPDRGVLLTEAVRTADAVVVTEGPDAAADAVDEVGRRDRAVEVLGLVGPDEPSGHRAAVGALRSAGATGCLVGIPWPWEPDAVGALADLW